MNTYKYFPHTQEDIQKMLKKIGVETLEQLYAEIPQEFLFKQEYDLPSSLSEIEIRRYFEALSQKNTSLTIFAGAGAYDHYTPAVINQIISRSEFLTAYTPYQPEISQGTLQYIFEFQSMISSLTGLPCANASMYDGATATAEAMMITIAASKKRNKVLISSTINPRVKDVVSTYAKFRGIELITIAQNDGCTNYTDMVHWLETGEIAGVIVSSPNYYGIIEDYSGFSDVIHANKALFIMNVDPSTLAILKSPEEWGADIACGDGQTLGIPLNFGGPYLGFLASTKELLRKLPGRIVGATHDVNGKRAYVLTLQAREQHIRREKANSNICSNQSLMALYVTIYLAIMGKQGLRQVNELCYSGAHYLYDRLLSTGKFTPVYDKPFLKEFVVKTTLWPKALNRKLLQYGIMGGIEIHPGELLFCVTEKRSRQEIDKLISLIIEE